MGRSRTPSEHHTTEYEELRLEKYSVQVGVPRVLVSDNLTMHYSKIFVNTLEFKIITLHQPILKQMVKQKLQIDPY